MSAFIPVNLPQNHVKNTLRTDALEERVGERKPSVPDGGTYLPPFLPVNPSDPNRHAGFLTCDPSGNPSAIVRPGVNFGRGDRGRHARDRGQDSKPEPRQSIPCGQDFFIQNHFFVRSVRWVRWLFDSPPLLPDNSTVMYEVVRHQQTSQIRMAIFLPPIFLPMLPFLPDFAHFCARYFFATRIDPQQ